MKERRSTPFGEKSQNSPQETFLAPFLEGTRADWVPASRSSRIIQWILNNSGDDEADGLGNFPIDEDHQVGEEDESAAAVAKPTDHLGTYGAYRQLASKILMQMRYFLSDDQLTLRTMAHYATIECLCVLSTRLRELLPRLHEVWQLLTASFDINAPRPVVEGGLHVFLLASRFSGDFLRTHFVNDVFSKLSTRMLRTMEPATERDAKAFHSNYRFQRAFLSACCQSSRDADLMVPIAPQLAAIGLLFLAKAVSPDLKTMAQEILTRVYCTKANDTIWSLCVEAAIYCAHGGLAENSPNGGANLKLKLAELNATALPSRPQLSLSRMNLRAFRSKEPKVDPWGIDRRDFDHEAVASVMSNLLRCNRLALQPFHPLSVAAASILQSKNEFNKTVT